MYGGMARSLLQAFLDPCLYTFVCSCLICLESLKAALVFEVAHLVLEDPNATKQAGLPGMTASGLKGEERDQRDSNKFTHGIS